MREGNRTVWAFIRKNAHPFFMFSVPSLYLIDRKTPIEQVVQYLEITPVRLVVVTDVHDMDLAYAICNRVVLDTHINGIVARYFAAAAETEDSPIALIGDFLEPIVPLGEQ